MEKEQGNKRTLDYESFTQLSLEEQKALIYFTTAPVFSDISKEELESAGITEKPEELKGILGGFVS